MRRFGETQVVRFGDDPRVTSFSMAQLIETSLLSAHCADNSHAIYLDVFNCAPYEPNDAARFSRRTTAGRRSSRGADRRERRGPVNPRNSLTRKFFKSATGKE
jgi:hypothetical protein